MVNVVNTAIGTAITCIHVYKQYLTPYVAGKWKRLYGKKGRVISYRRKNEKKATIEYTDKV